ncbi:hypothetical protein PV326_008468 [Microctonus aethiopoides]|nr:hypothetical protein PV326_008468 [Microctonus aethiopoides]
MMKLAIDELKQKKKKNTLSLNGIVIRDKEERIKTLSSGVWHYRSGPGQSGTMIEALYCWAMVSWWFIGDLLVVVDCWWGWWSTQFPGHAGPSFRAGQPAGQRRTG